MTAPTFFFAMSFAALATVVPGGATRRLPRSMTHLTRMLYMGWTSSSRDFIGRGYGPRAGPA